jgi:hypothetical protein
MKTANQNQKGEKAMQNSANNPVSEREAQGSSVQTAQMRIGRLPDEQGISTR